MRNDLILDFPVLSPDTLKFNEDVSYDVEAKIKQDKFVLTHMLRGNSFIKNLIKKKQAQFSTTLYYEANRKRQNYTSNYNYEIMDNDDIKFVHEIKKILSYPPQMNCSLVLTGDDFELKCDKKSGLSNPDNEKITIPRYAKIAVYPTLQLQSKKSDFESLIHIKSNDDYNSGQLKVSIQEGNFSKRPIEAICSKGVYDKLSSLSAKNLRSDSSSAKDDTEALEFSIVTQILTAAYYELAKKEEAIEHPLLKNHLKNHLDDEDCLDKDFEPSLEATKNLPFKILSKGTHDPD